MATPATSNAAPASTHCIRRRTLSNGSRGCQDKRLEFGPFA
jgi:hypothetical protein